MPSEILRQAIGSEFLIDKDQLEHYQTVLSSKILETAKWPDIIIYSEHARLCTVTSWTYSVNWAESYQCQFEKEVLL